MQLSTLDNLTQRNATFMHMILEPAEFPKKLLQNWVEGNRFSDWNIREARHLCVGGTGHCSGGRKPPAE